LNYENEYIKIILTILTILNTILIKFLALLSIIIKW